MTEFDLYVEARQRLERVWREAERHARLFAAWGELAPDAETVTSREGGGRA